MKVKKYWKLKFATFLAGLLGHTPFKVLKEKADDWAIKILEKEMFGEGNEMH